MGKGCNEKVWCGVNKGGGVAKRGKEGRGSKRGGRIGWEGPEERGVGRRKGGKLGGEGGGREGEGERREEGEEWKKEQIGGGQKEGGRTRRGDL